MTTATEEVFDIHSILRAVSGALEIPVVVILIFLILCSVALLGWLIAELISERRHMKVKLPELLDNIRSGDRPIEETISSSGLLKSQKAALIELLKHPGFNGSIREALAVRLIEQEQAKYDKIVRLSELVAKLGPMFGLLGTLIPLGPGIIALGQGDTYTLSTSLMTAFDTTIAGLSAAAVATVISTIRKAWYKEYMSILEVLAECVLETVKESDEAYERDEVYYEKADR
jgi:biopolymer transport protein ExbB/TolQ